MATDDKPPLGAFWPWHVNNWDALTRGFFVPYGTSHDVILAAVLAGFGNDGGNGCYPRLTTLARCTGLSRDTIRAQLSALERSQLIQCTGITAQGAQVYSIRLPDTVPCGTNALMLRAALLHNLRPWSRYVLGCIAATAGNDGRTGNRCPSYDDLCRGVGDGKNVQRAVRNLLELGLIRQRERARRGHRAAWDVTYGPDAQEWIAEQISNRERDRRKLSSIAEAQSRTITPRKGDNSRRNGGQKSAGYRSSTQTTDTSTFGVAAQRPHGIDLAGLRQQIAGRPKDEALTLADRALAYVEAELQQLRNLEYNAGPDRQQKIRALYGHQKDVRKIVAELREPGHPSPGESPTTSMDETRQSDLRAQQATRRIAARRICVPADSAAEPDRPWAHARPLEISKQELEQAARDYVRSLGRDYAPAMRKEIERDFVRCCVVSGTPPSKFAAIMRRAMFGDPT